MPVRKPPRDERGAVAILFALLAVVLLSVAALATDIGNAVARRTATQTQADFAALAAVSKLEGPIITGATPSATVVDTVRDSLNANQPQDDARSCSRTSPPTCVTSAQLTDGILTNGEVRFTDVGLQVVSPEAWVDFGLAEVFGSSGTNVSSRATVNLYSGGKRVMPAYGVSACAYGRQVLSDPASGQVAPVVPTVAKAGDVNNTDLSGPPVLTDASGTAVNTLTPLSTGNKLTLTGSKWDNTRKVGFFRDGSTDEALVQKQGTFWLSGDSTQTPRAPYSSNPSTTVQLMIPDAVTQTEGVWWIRVFNGPDDTGMWSPAIEALSIRVGNAVLECGAGSMEGNFGALRLPRTDVGPNDYLAMNIALGLQKPLTPTVHREAVASLPTVAPCEHGVNGAIASDYANRILRRGTNCVGTDPGLPANAATRGLVTGVGTTTPGMLTTAPTRTGCDPTGGSLDRTARLNNRDYSFNNEVLSCYLTDSTTTLGFISTASYNGPPVLDKAIFSSPRFIYIPVLGAEGGGASTGYSIIDFRPAFITDESLATTKGTHTATAENGVRIERNDVTQITVVMFNLNALPNDSDVPLIDFLGVGEPITRLVD